MELSKPPTYHLVLDYADKIDSQNFLVHYSSCEDNEFPVKATSHSPVKLTFRGKSTRFSVNVLLGNLSRLLLLGRCK